MQTRVAAVAVVLCACGSATDLSAAAEDARASCSTTISYGSGWFRPAHHPGDTDVATGVVTWDGACVEEGANSYAQLSNGWRPHFAGHGHCVVALDTKGCGPATGCATRATYAASWIHAAQHPRQFDDVAGRLSWDGACANGSATLSNGWTPAFAGACGISLRYTQCGGLYQNPVIPTDCPDPGVLRDGNDYVLTCTSGGAADAYPIYTSRDLVHWTASGHVFPRDAKPRWAVGDFWAPEIHKVGAHYVAYFSARHRSGRLAVGAAQAPSPTGPFTDVGAPLVLRQDEGVIDASEFEDAQGRAYLVWKVDGNANGKPTPIFAQPLTADGLALSGQPVQLITNDRSWEGAVTEGPFVVAHGGWYYLFYSGNSYANASYALGVARARNPLGPYEKHGAPIVATNADWIGPGHCSVVPAPSGEWAVVYHAWHPGQVNTPGAGRVVLVDALDWSDGWPRALQAPSATSQPLP